MRAAPAILDAEGAPVAAATIADIRAGAAPQPAYDSASFETQTTAAWAPGLYSADAAAFGSEITTTARVQDLIRNDPSARAARERLIDMLVGPGLRLVARPDGDALGLTPEETRKLARDLEREWRLIAGDPLKRCDARRQSSMGGLQRLFCADFVVEGEATFCFTTRADPGQRYETCLIAVDPRRLSNPHSRFPSKALRGGVEMDAFGAAVAYHVRNAHQSDWWSAGDAWTWTRVPKQTRAGRPVFVHAFEPERAGQTRAVSPFAVVVEWLRKVTRHGDLEIANAAANAMFTAFVETMLPADEVALRLGGSPSGTASASGREQFFKRSLDSLAENPPRLTNGARISVLPPNSKVAMNATARQTTAYPDFARSFLNRIAAPLGVSGEQITQDWSQVNYSSARAALNEVWRGMVRRAAVYDEQVMAPIYYAFMQEAFYKGYIQIPAHAPPFEAAAGAYLAGRWIHPGRGSVDPVKEAEASGLAMANCVSTLADEAAMQGRDWEENLEQQARERDKRRELGLPEPVYGQPGPVAGEAGADASPPRDRKAA